MFQFFSFLFGASGRTRTPFASGFISPLFNCTWPNAGLAHTAIFVYSLHAMFLLLFVSDLYLTWCSCSFGFIWVSGCAMVTGSTVYYWSWLPCKRIELRWQTFISRCLEGTGMRETRLITQWEMAWEGKYSSWLIIGSSGIVHEKRLKNW